MEGAATTQANGRSLEGRFAIVTGAGTGIGREIGGRSARIVQGSVTKRDVAKRATADAQSWFSPADILANNAHSFTNPKIETAGPVCPIKDPIMSFDVR